MSDNIKEEKKKRRRSLEEPKRCSGGGEKRRKIKEEKKKKKKSSGGLKRCSSSSDIESSNKRNKCPYPLFGLNYFFPDLINCYKIPPGVVYPDCCFRYPNEVFPKDTKPLHIKEGKRLKDDVFQLLSNGGETKCLVRNSGERVELEEAIKGKTLIICCFFVPMLAEAPSIDTIYSLIKTYSELKKNKDINIEMVMVAKMRCSFISEDEEEPALYHFFSAFPCLAVPFSDSSYRDKICKRLGLGADELNYKHSCLFLDPGQIVLQTDDAPIAQFGAASFPFTNDHLLSLERKYLLLRIKLNPLDLLKYNLMDVIQKPVTLEELLCCPSSKVLSTCGGGNNNLTQKISVSDLSHKKCVALYLCRHLTHMSRLEQIRKKCVELGHELEIIIVYVHTCYNDESSYFDAVNLALTEKQISSWWELPFVDHVSRMLYTHLISSPDQDEVIFWTDGGHDTEVRGRDIMREFGSPDNYPFTRTKLAKVRLTALRSLTLESFLGENGRLHCKDGRYFDVSHLKNKNILLYLEVESDDYVYKLLLDSYEQIKIDYPDSELVFVPMHPNDKSFWDGSR